MAIAAIVVLAVVLAIVMSAIMPCHMFWWPFALSSCIVVYRRASSCIVVHTAVLAVVATLSPFEPLLRSSQIRNSVVKLPGKTMCAMKFDAVAVVGNVNL
jgi:hypothetical protein